MKFLVLRFSARVMATLLLLVSIVPHSSGQLSVKPYLFAPTGELGFVGEKKFTVELGYFSSSLFEKDWRTRLSLSIFKLKPRMDVFPIVGTISPGEELTVSPGEQSFEKFTMALLSVGMDRQVVGSEKIKFFLGTDLQAGGASIAYENNVPLIEDGSYSGGGVIAGFRFRIGSEVLVSDNFIVGIEANRLYGIIMEHMLYTANDVGLVMSYYFD